MGTSQATAQAPKTINIGSAAAFYSLDSGGAFTNVGLGDGFAFTEEMTPLDSAPDNGIAPDILRGLANQTATITGNLWEYDLTKLNAIRGGVDILSTVASSLVSGEVQTVASGDWAYDIPIELAGQNQSGLVPTINSVTGGTDGALVLLTDYVVIKLPTGNFAISILDSVTVTTEAQTIAIDTDYTPSASTTLTTGGLSSMTPIWWRFINYVADVADAVDAAANAGISAADAIYRRTTYDFYSCTVNGGDAATFKNKDDTSPEVPYVLSLMSEIDTTRSTLGDQLKSVKKDIVLQSSVTI